MNEENFLKNRESGSRQSTGDLSVLRLPLPMSEANVAMWRSVEGRFIFYGPDEEIFKFIRHFYFGSKFLSSLGVASEQSERATCRNVGGVSIPKTQPTTFLKK